MEGKVRNIFTVKICTTKEKVIQGEGRGVEEMMKGLAVRGEKAKDLEATKTMNFWWGNPRMEEITGVMHLYRNIKNPPQSRETLPVGRSSLVCVLAVPNYMTYADFCQFTGSLIQNILEMRVVRNDGLTDRYSILMRFDNQKSADDFYRHYNRKPFSSLEAEICHVLYTADVQYTGPFEHATTPPTGLTELPTCPVCLERFDSHINGILTTICNHPFHSTCISKWTDSSCLVCRYSQQEPEKPTCSVCSTSENLWICVICGFVGCGRYQYGHAMNHWKKSQHCYSLGVDSQRVWDYVGNDYVYWLIQSKTDERLVEVNTHCRYVGDECESCESSYDSRVESALFDSKIDAEQVATLRGERDTLLQERDQLRAQLQVVLRDDGEVGSLRAQVTELQRRLDIALDEFETENARAGFYRRHMMLQGIVVPSFSDHSTSRPSGSRQSS